MTPTEKLIWKTALKNPAWGAPEISVALDIAEDLVVKTLAKSGSAKPERIRLLERGIELTGGDRNKTYGPPWENLTACAQMWEAYVNAKFNLDLKLTAEDVAHMMTLVKMTRTFYGSYHADNYLDGAVYQAIAGECRLEEER